MRSCASVSLMEEFIGITLSVETALLPSPPRAPNRRRARWGRERTDQFHRHHFIRGRARALEHVKTFAPLGSESE